MSSIDTRPEEVIRAGFGPHEFKDDTHDPSECLRCGAHAALDALVAERDRAVERVDLLEVLGEQAASTIAFLHGCLTDPGYSYGYPEQTERRLAELRQFLPHREVCIHSKSMPDCQGCRDGEHAREVMGRARAAPAGDEA